MKREQLLARIETAWEAFQSSHADLPEVRLLEPGVAGDWSVKDTIAHVSWWEEETLTHLPHIVSGGQVPRYSVMYGGIDAFNTLMAEQKRALPLVDVLRQSEETHQRLVELVASASEELITRETRFRRRLRLDTYGHYPIHTAAIRAWRQQRERG